MNGTTRIALFGIIGIVIAAEILALWSKVDATNIALTGLGALGGYIGSEVKHALEPKVPTTLPDKPDLTS